jgi:hypothetical protein
MLVTDIRALRYNAVAQRATQTMTLNTQAAATNPNQYTFTNYKGLAIVRSEESGVNIDSTSAATISFNNTGATGSTGNLTVSVSMGINGDRGDRYTITITPTGTVSTAYSSFVP